MTCVDFVGADLVSPSRYAPDQGLAMLMLHRLQVRESADGRLSMQPVYLGRDPALLKRLSDASGLRILTNTGYTVLQTTSICPGMRSPRPPNSSPRAGFVSSSTASTRPQSSPHS